MGSEINLWPILKVVKVCLFICFCYLTCMTDAALIKIDNSNSLIKLQPQVISGIFGEKITIKINSSEEYIFEYFYNTSEITVSLSIKIII